MGRGGRPAAAAGTRGTPRRGRCAGRGGEAAACRPATGGRLAAGSRRRRAAPEQERVCRHGFHFRTAPPPGADRDFPYLADPAGWAGAQGHGGGRRTALRRAAAADPDRRCLPAPSPGGRIALAGALNSPRSSGLTADLPADARAGHRDAGRTVRRRLNPSPLTRRLFRPANAGRRYSTHSTHDGGAPDNTAGSGRGWVTSGHPARQQRARRPTGPGAGDQGGTPA